MNDDLIKREDAIKAVRSTVAQYVPFLNGINMTLPLECETALRSVPSADRPQGEWITDDDGDKKCSNCGEYAPLSKERVMLIDSVDLIRKLPMMIQGNKTFAKFSEGGDYHIGEVDSWCLNYKEIVEGIESYCEYKRTNQYKLGAPVNGSFALNSYDYDEPQTERSSE